jgi:hypothetical protein
VKKKVEKSQDTAISTVMKVPICNGKGSAWICITYREESSEREQEHDEMVVVN